MIRRARQLLFMLALAGAGCAASHPGQTARSLAPPATAPSTEPVNPVSLLPLDQLQPVPHLPAPATRPATRPSLEALELYGKSRDAQATGQRYNAISALEKAILLDPTSYDFYFDLARAYLAISGTDDRAIPALVRAAALEPDHLDLHILLGQQYLARGELANGIEQLRLALQTTEYNTDDGQAAVADFYLARALKEAGDDRAALDEYDTLLRRLDNPSLPIRQTPELSYLIDHPELMYVQIGELYEKHQAYEQAVKAYEPAAQHDPDNLTLQAHLARALASLGRTDQALSTAGEIVMKSGASADSLATLRDVAERLNLPNSALDTLLKLRHDHPADRPVFFGLLDLLQSRGQLMDVRYLLESDWQKSPGDVQLVRRLVAVQEQMNAVPDAARVLVLALAADPDGLQNFAPLWTSLLRPGRINRLRLETLQSLSVPAQAEPARDFWVSRLADFDHRDALSKSALQKSTQASPPFAPGYRGMLNLIWAEDDLSPQQKIDQSEQLAASASAGGKPALAMELRGLALLNQKKPSEAVDLLGRAVRLGDRSPDLLLSYALAIRQPGKDAQFEQLMWKLISDHPLYEEAYAVLFRYYADADVSSLNQAMKVLSSWITADPSSIPARVIAANVAGQLGQSREAETELLELFKEAPDNGQVLQGLRDFYMRGGRLGELITRLENYRAAHPQDTYVVAQLVDIYTTQSRLAEASRVIDATRLAVGGDADLLYNVAQLYNRIDQKPSAENVLQQVIQVNPTHAGASNDLGFSWADQGKNLPLAESLIRTAVSAEPDNQSFLDSLGWVLYKRGKFDEAKKYLEQAIGPAAFPDPVVLDHLGDTLYRLNNSTDAQQQWQRSLKGIGDGDIDRPDLKQLRLQLRQKLKQSQSKETVEVAPIGKQ